jgi:hypothetical protein
MKQNTLLTSKSHVRTLNRILKHLLYECRAEQRCEWRDALGDEWRQLLEFTRAMTSERHFESLLPRACASACEVQSLS